MKVKEDMIKHIELLGFNDVSDYDDDATCSYYRKCFGNGNYIEIGDSYNSTNTDITIYLHNEEAGDYVPSFALFTLFQMFQQGFIEEG